MHFRNVPLVVDESREDQSPQNKIKSVVSRTDALHKHSGTRRTNKFIEYYPSFKKEFWVSSRIQVLPAEEKKRRMARNYAINSKKQARTPFVKWARAHKHAFIVNDPELKAQLTTYID